MTATPIPTSASPDRATEPCACTGARHGLHAGGHPAGAFTVTKLFDDLPCCHRSWAHDGRCVYLHGYERSFELEFACAELDPATGFVIDFSALKGVRARLAEQFDHTTLVAEDDPELPLFRTLAERGIVDLRVMRHTGMEGAAVWVLAEASRLVEEATGGRVWVSRVEARESRKNAVVLTASPGGR